MNKIFIMGRLTADPELSSTASGISVCKFNVAVPRPKRKDAEQETDFFTVQAWRGTADFVSKYFSKGKKILVTGVLRNNNFVGRDNVKRYENIIIAENVEFAGDKTNSETSSSDINAPDTEMRDTTIRNDDYTDLEDFEEVIDSNVPF